MARRAWIDGTFGLRGVNILRDMPRRVAGAGLMDKVRRVIALVGADGATLRSQLQRAQHFHRRIALRLLSRRSHVCGDNQSVPIIHHDVAQVTQRAAGAFTFAREARVGIRDRLVSRVRALLAVKIHGRISGIPIGRRRTRVVLSPKTLLTRVRFQQRPVNREMLLRQQPVRVGDPQHGCRNASAMFDRR